MKARWKMREREYAGGLVIIPYENKPSPRCYWKFIADDDVNWPFPPCRHNGGDARNGLFTSREAALEDAKAHGITWEE